MMNIPKGTHSINLKMFYTLLVSHVGKNDKFEPFHNLDYNLFSLNDYSSNLFSLQQKLTNWLLKIHTIYIYCLVVVFRLHIIWHIIFSAIAFWQVFNNILYKLRTLIFNKSFRTKRHEGQWYFEPSVLCINNIFISLDI